MRGAWLVADLPSTALLLHPQGTQRNDVNNRFLPFPKSLTHTHHGGEDGVKDVTILRDPTRPRSHCLLLFASREPHREPHSSKANAPRRLTTGWCNVYTAVFNRVLRTESSKTPCNVSLSSMLFLTRPLCSCFSQGRSTFS